MEYISIRFDSRQFAEAAYSAVPIAFLLKNYETLAQLHYPLQNYDAFSNCILVDSFRGTFANLPAFIVFRPTSKQLVVSICGTASLKHAFQDLRLMKSDHPSGHGRVHTGFLALYLGLKETLLTGIYKGITEHSPTELVLTGHSMGAAISYLFCMDLLGGSIPLNLKLCIASFGTPRCGDSHLVHYFQTLVHSFQSKLGPESFTEYSVKGYNDGASLFQLATPDCSNCFSPLLKAFLPSHQLL